MNIDPSSTKYVIKANIVANGIVEKPDVVGAIFGQTEGLLGDDLDLRELQKGGRIGRIEVDIESKKGKSEGTILIPSSLDQVETAILASSLETVSRVGPCKATVAVEKIEDVRVSKRKQVVERAKTLLTLIMEESKSVGVDITESVRQAVQIEEISSYGSDKCPAGPHIKTSDAIVIVEGRSDVLTLLRYGIKNAIGVEGTSIPNTIKELTKEKIATVFVDGDRGGDLILKELLQVGEVDFIAKAPPGREVEELTQKQIMKALRNKIPTEQYIEMYGIKAAEKPDVKGKPLETKVASKKLNEREQLYKRLLDKLSGTLKAEIIDAQGKTVMRSSVRELPNTLRNVPKEGTALIFDGIITQRLLDNALGSPLKTIVGVKLGPVPKQPTNFELLTIIDFGATRST